MDQRRLSSLVRGCLRALVLNIATFVLVSAQSAGPACPIRFRITLAKDIAPKGASGRLFVLMSDSTEPKEILSTGFAPGSDWIAAMEVNHMAPDRTVDFDPDILAYPRPFSQAKPGVYQFMALLDPDHDYPYNGQNAGDLYGPVIQAKLDGTTPIELVLNKITEASSKPADTDNIKLVEFHSPLLSAFWGRSIVMQAGVVLPPSYRKALNRTYPAVYDVHGFGDDHTAATRLGPKLLHLIGEGKRAEMVRIFLNGHLSTGHHEFADSVNNGPWGRALTQEFIPYLEKKFRLVARPSARFLTGHSSGGWSTLWLQITYPEFFGGTWSTAPDPVDLRSFTGVNVTPGSTENFFRTRDGKPRNLVRVGGKEVASIEQFVRQEVVQGEYGGQFPSFEWVWSPKGPGGRPLQLFNRETGELNPEVQRAWEKYDIRLLLERNWTTLGPKLRSKINVICGGEDTFHLEEAVKLLCDFFKRNGSDAVCEIVPGRDHSNLYESYKTYPNGLGERINREMWAKFKASRAERPAHFSKRARNSGRTTGQISDGRWKSRRRTAATAL